MLIQSEIVDGALVLRLDSPPLNTITLELLSQLGESIQQARENSAVKGVVISGTAAHFSAGADIDLFRQVTSTEDAIRLCQVFQTAFQKLEDCTKPVVAALNGRVIGGALELAMACHHRVAGSGSRFTMPEVRLGINPGAGGTQRLPRLVGPAAALRMLLTADTVDAQRALDWGLVDVVCPSEQVISRARNLALSAPPLRKTREQTHKVQDAQVRDAAYQEAELLLSDARPEILAPWKIVEAVKAGLEESYEAGLSKEQQVFDQCMQSLATRNKIYLFFATRETSKFSERAGEKIAPVGQAAIIGEIIRRKSTASEILSAARQWSQAIHNTPELVASREGVMVTRVTVPYVQEAFWLLEEGASAAAIDQAAVAFGYSMGPLVLMDLMGLDILAHSQRVLASALPRHGSLSRIVDRLVQRGHLGQKTGAGIYRYEPGSHVPRECAATAEIIASVQRENGQTPRDVPPDEITQRLVLRMVSEAFCLLEEGGARSQSDVDVATVLGTGFPDFRGGVLKYANDLGLNRVLASLDELAGRLGERFSPCRLLQKMEGDS